MVIELIKPQNAIKLFAGLSAMFFEKFNGSEFVENGDSADLAAVPAPPKQDDLTEISGIGPTFARRLQEAGVDTFAKLAEVTPEFVKETAQVRDWQGDPAAWIAEAGALA